MKHRHEEEREEGSEEHLQAGAEDQKVAFEAEPVLNVAVNKVGNQ